MQFESSLKRNYWMNASLALIPDSVISVCIAHYFNLGSMGFLYSMLGLQCLYFLIWLKVTIWRWLFFYFRGKKLMVEHIETFLKASRFPAPNEIETSAEGYLYSIIGNNELDPIMRAKAAVEIGSLNYPLSTQRIQEGLHLNMAFEEAIANYKKHLEYKS